MARRAAWLGALCAFGPGAILFGWYYAKHHQTVAMPWAQIAVTSLVLAPLTGAAFGGLIRWFAERSGRPIASGIIGGALASIVPGIFAVAVFGSYRGPYAGSAEIAVMNIAISILRLSRGLFEVVATSGDAALGGDDFDQRVFCWVVEEAKLSPLSPQDMRLLLVKSREAKEYLTAHGEARITARLSSGEWVDLALDTETFCRITQHLVHKTDSEQPLVTIYVSHYYSSVTEP
jgi:hypothetical protein